MNDTRDLFTTLENYGSRYSTTMRVPDGRGLLAPGLGIGPKSAQPGRPGDGHTFHAVFYPSNSRVDNGQNRACEAPMCRR